MSAEPHMIAEANTPTILSQHPIKPFVQNVKGQAHRPQDAPAAGRRYQFWTMSGHVGPIRVAHF